jgi:hypothetical protein
VISRHELPTHQVAITGASGRLQITIDGHELRTCTRARLTLDADSPLPVLELSLLVLDDLTTAVPAVVLLDDSARQALLAMGWTPPED